MCWIVHDLETSTVRWYRPQLVHCSTHKKEVAWWFYVPWLFGQPRKRHVKKIYLLTAVWYPVCSLSVCDFNISELLIFVLHVYSKISLNNEMYSLHSYRFCFPLIICNNVFWLLIFYNGWPTSTHMRAAKFVKDSPAGPICV